MGRQSGLAVPDTSCLGNEFHGKTRQLQEMTTMIERGFLVMPPCLEKNMTHHDTTTCYMTILLSPTLAGWLCVSAVFSDEWEAVALSRFSQCMVVWDS